MRARLRYYISSGVSSSQLINLPLSVKTNSDHTRLLGYQFKATGLSVNDEFDIRYKKALNKFNLLRSSGYFNNGWSINVKLTAFYSQILPIFEAVSPYSPNKTKADLFELKLTNLLKLR